MSFEAARAVFQIFLFFCFFLLQACKLDSSWQSLRTHFCSLMRRAACNCPCCAMCWRYFIRRIVEKSAGVSAEPLSSLLGPATVVWAPGCVQRSRLHRRIFINPIQLDEPAGCRSCCLCDRKGPVAQDAIIRRFRTTKRMNSWNSGSSGSDVMTLPNRVHKRAQITCFCTWICEICGFDASKPQQGFRQARCVFIYMQEVPRWLQLPRPRPLRVNVCL